MSDYKFSRVNLTPSVAEELILLKLQSGQLRRSQIIADALNHHKTMGGLPCNGDITSTFKKALSNLIKKGKVHTPVVGLYFLSEESDSAQSKSSKDVQSSTDVSKGIKSEEEVIDSDSINKIKAQKTVGSGNGCVYLYYFDAYGKIAQSKGEGVWLCKIGLSDGEAGIRISSQVGTALPEVPILALEIKTDEPSTLEAAIHSVLTLRGKWSKSSPGSEWFITNPDEVLEIFEFIKGN